MATTEIKALEKITKEILEKVKNLVEKKPAEVCNETLDKINEKLETIDERLAVPNSSDVVSAEIISKVDALSTKLEEKSEDYIKEIQLAFDSYNQKSAEMISVENGTSGADIKDFVAIVTNEMMDLKNQFEKFNTEFTDISLNTGMAVSKEVVSLKNYVLSLNDAVENIKTRVEKFNPQTEIAEPISDKLNSRLTTSVDEVFNTTLNSFKNEVFALLAKVTDGIVDVVAKIAEVSDNLKTFEGIELSLGEIIANQQKNKAEILKIIQNNIETENKKLVPQIMQLVNSISFEEDAEEIKDGLYAVNENLGIVNKNIETGTKATEQILGQIEDMSTVVKASSQEVTDVVKGDLTQKLSKIDEVLNLVSTEMTILTKGSKEDTGEYLYTLLDLESDISKVRVILDELNSSLRDDRSLAESVTKNISDKISNLNTFVEDAVTLYTSPDYKELLNQFDSLNDDITSISKRTNKLILTSDDASEKLQKNIADFQEIMQNISDTVLKFEKSSILKTISIKIDNIQKLLLSLSQSDKAMNEVFGYLASWIDTTTEDIKEIKSDLAVLKSAKPEQNEETGLASIEKLLKETNKKLAENSKRMDLLEQRLETVSPLLEEKLAQITPALETVADNGSANKTINKKLDKMEKQIQQLLSFVEEE